MWDKIPAALTYLLPGFVAYIMLYKPLTGAKSESDLSTTAKSVLWSVVLASTADLYASSRGYHLGLDNPGTTVWLFTMAVLSGAVAGICERKCRLSTWFWGMLGRVTSAKLTVWQEVLDFRSVGGRYVFVRLGDGSVYYGALTQVTEIPEDGETELLLEDTWFLPATAEEQGDMKWVQIDRPVYIPGAAVAAIELGRTGEELRSRT